LPKSRRPVVAERALRTGVLSAAPPVRRPASTQVYGCKALDKRSSVDLEADLHKLFAALQNSLYWESVLRSAKITVANYFIRKRSVRV
jgi:hypothetical protein